MGSIEENQNQKIKGGVSTKRKRKKIWFRPKLELKIKEKFQDLDEERGNGREIHIES